MTEKKKKAGPKEGWPNFKCHPDIYKQIRHLAAEEDKRIIELANELLTSERHVEAVKK